MTNNIKIKNIQLKETGEPGFELTSIYKTTFSSFFNYEEDISEAKNA